MMQQVTYPAVQHTFEQKATIVADPDVMKQPVQWCSKILTNCKRAKDTNDPRQHGSQHTESEAHLTVQMSTLNVHKQCDECVTFTIKHISCLSFPVRCLQCTGMSDNSTKEAVCPVVNPDTKDAQSHNE